MVAPKRWAADRAPVWLHHQATGGALGRNRAGCAAAVGRGPETTAPSAFFSSFGSSRTSDFLTIDRVFFGVSMGRPLMILRISPGREFVFEKRAGKPVRVRLRVLGNDVSCARILSSTILRMRPVDDLRRLSE